MYVAGSVGCRLGRAVQTATLAVARFGNRWHCAHPDDRMQRPPADQTPSLPLGTPTCGRDDPPQLGGLV